MASEAMSEARVHVPAAVSTAYLDATPGRGKCFVYDVARVDRRSDGAAPRPIASLIGVAASDRLRACKFADVVKPASRFALFSLEGDDLLVFLEQRGGGDGDDGADDGRRPDAVLARCAVGDRLVVAAVSTAVEWAAVEAAARRPLDEGRVSLVLTCGAAECGGRGLHRAVRSAGGTSFLEPRWLAVLLAASATSPCGAFRARLAAGLFLETFLARRVAREREDGRRFVLVADDASRRCADAFAGDYPRCRLALLYRSCERVVGLRARAAGGAAEAAWAENSVGINHWSTAGLGYLQTPLPRSNRTRFP